MADKEYDYLKTPAPVDAEPSFVQKAGKELRQRWWLWSVVVFAVLVAGALLAFRGSLYTQNVGMPMLAVTENAEELCSSKCTADVGLDEAGEPKNREKFDSCLSSCVKGETEQVAEERKDFADEQKKEVEEEKKKEEGEEKKDDAAEEKKEEQEAKVEAAANAEAGARKLRKLLADSEIIQKAMIAVV